eukprot:Pgem_evm1s4606
MNMINLAVLALILMLKCVTSSSLHSTMIEREKRSFSMSGLAIGSTFAEGLTQEQKDEIKKIFEEARKDVAKVEKWFSCSEKYQCLLSNCFVAEVDASCLDCFDGSLCPEDNADTTASTESATTRKRDSCSKDQSECAKTTCW